MAIQTASKQFGVMSGVLNAVRSILPINIGIPESIANSQNQAYMVTLDVFNPKTTIRAFLQDKFVFNVESSWSDAGSMDGFFGQLSDAVQFTTGHSLVNTLSTRRKWRGSSPISLTMKLKFEAFEDVQKEVIAPCEKLQSLALPSGGLKAGIDQFFVRPPGPNPYYFPNAKLPTGKFQPFGPGQTIRISIGNFITFQSIIVNSVEVTFESRMSKDGPIGAEVLVRFQTYEMLTKETLLDAYQGIGFESITREQQVSAEASSGG